MTNHAGAWFLATCMDCEPVLPQSFKDEGERDAWATAHRAGTGHKEVVRTPVPCVISPGTKPPKITVEVWDGADQYPFPRVVDVVRIDDTWHVVVTLDD